MDTTINIAVIQFYFYPDVSAVAQMLQDLLVELAKDRRFNISVFAGATSYRNKRLSLRKIDYNNIRIRRFFTFSFGRRNLVSRILNYSFYYISIFFYLLVTSKWQIVISMTSPPLIGFVVSLSRMIRRRTMILYIQDLYPDILYDVGIIKKPWLARRLQFFNRITYRTAQKIVTIGSYMTKRIVTIDRDLKKRIIEIPNWARGIERKDPVNQQRNSFNILYSGNMGASHDFETLAYFIEKAKSLPGICYTFIGEGVQKERLNNLFKRKGEGRVRFEGYAGREEVNANLAKGDLLLLAQKKQTVGDVLPSKFYSYLAAGRPIFYLGPRRSEIGTMILKHDIGIVCEERHDIKIALEYIKALKNNRNVCEVVGRRARRVFEESCRFEYSFDLFKQLLEQES